MVSGGLWWFIVFVVVHGGLLWYKFVKSGQHGDK